MLGIAKGRTTAWRPFVAEGGSVREIQSVCELPGVLAGPYTGRKSGFLHFAREGERRSIRFRDGRIVYASTNVVEHRLGETLVRYGRLRPEELTVASEVLRRDGGFLGSVLLREGLLDERQLVEALEIHTRTVVEPLFAWESGGYEFVGDERAAPVAHHPPGVFTLDVIAAATRRMEDPEEIRAAVRDMSRPLVHGDLPAGVRSFVLTADEAATLRLVDGARTAQQIVALRPSLSRVTLRSLLTLLCTGVVKWLPGTAGSRSPREAAFPDTPVLFEMREAFARAETLVAVERYWDAIRILEPLGPRIADPVLRQAARVLLARAYLNNPLWVRRAEELLQNVIGENPLHVDALFLLGQVYRAEGLNRRVETMLRRALAGQPGHRGAAEELQALVGAKKL